MSRKSTPSPIIRTFHNLKDWSPVIEKGTITVGTRIYPTHTYSSMAKVGVNDILYRETDMPGSYIFYLPTMLDCDLTPIDSPAPYPFLVTLARQKVTKRGDIKLLREELLEHLALPH